MMKIKSRHKLPKYAEYGGFRVTKDQLLRIFPRFHNHPIGESGNNAVHLAQLHDGSWWVKWEGSTIFWSWCWYAIPASVGKRAEKIDQYVEKIAKQIK